MRIKTESLSLLASIMSGQYGIDVKSDGTSAYSYRDDKGRGHIVIPTLVDDDEMLSLIRGYIDHETAHLIFTDFSLIPGNDETIRRIHNIYEDVLVERRISGRFGGCHVNLERLNELVLHAEAQNVEEFDNTPESLAVVLMNYILCRSSSTAYPIMIPDAAQHRDVLLSAGMTADFLDGLDALIERVRTVTSTADTLALAKETVEYLRECLPQQNSEQGDGQSQSQNQSSDGDSDSQSQSQSNGADSQSQSQSRGQQILQELEHTDIGDVSQKAAELISENQQDEGLTSDVDRCIDVQNDPAGASRLSSWVSPKFIPVNEDDRSEAYMATAQLRQRMSSLLQGYVLNRTGGCRRGRIDGHRLARLAVSDPRVFVRKTEKIDVSADIMILADASGSMDNSKTRHLMTLGMHSIVTALRSIRGVRVAAYAFGGEHYIRLTDYDTRERDSNLCMHEACGETYAGSALHHAIQYMQRNARPNKGRKILLIMTDGEMSDEQVFTADVEAADKLGIEVLGLGLVCGSITYLLPEGRSQVINSFDEFPQAIFTLMQDKLMRRQ